MQRHRGRRTVHQLENALAQFCTWLVGPEHCGFGQLKPSTVRDYIASLGRFRRSTVAVHASALRGFFGYLRLDGTLTTDLAAVIELPPRYSLAHPPQVLSPSAVEELLAGVGRSTALGKRDLAMLLQAARYGLHPSDIRPLRFEQVRWREQRILVVQSATLICACSVSQSH
jgi:site-specific recombinase XerD